MAELIRKNEHKVSPKTQKHAGTVQQKSERS
jgi:hypothetical protein